MREVEGVNLRQISKDSRDGWWDWKELCLRGHIIFTNDGNMICSLEIAAHARP